MTFDRTEPDVLLERALALVHHDMGCALVLGMGDEDCTCDAEAFLRDLEAALGASS